LQDFIHNIQRAGKNNWLIVELRIAQQNENLSFPSKLIAVTIIVAETHCFYVAPARGKNFDVAPAPAPTLLFSKTTILNK
jgi:hypothetical protein